MTEYEYILRARRQDLLREAEHARRVRQFQPRTSRRFRLPAR